jgi:hemin uptake protein HemP
LLAGGNEVQIEHNGEIYTLRQTSKGKLILTK